MVEGCSVLEFCQRGGHLSMVVLLRLLDIAAARLDAAEELVCVISLYND